VPVLASIASLSSQENAEGARASAVTGSPNDATRKLPIAFSERLASDWLFVIFAIFCENDSLPSPCVIVAGCTLTINPHC